MFSHSVTSDSLWSMDCSSRLPSPSLLAEFAQTHASWVGDAIQPSHPLSSHSPPDLNLSQHQGLLQMSWLFESDSQSFGASASVSVLSLNIKGWFPLGLTGLISLLSKGLLQHHSSKVSILQCSAFFMVQLSHPYITLAQAGQKDWRGKQDGQCVWAEKIF